MSGNRRPDYKVYVTQKRRSAGDYPPGDPRGQEDVYYKEVGAAWLVKRDGISVKLFALPVSGELVLFPPREKDNDADDKNDNNEAAP